MSSIPPQLRHDAPEQNRPYVAYSPILYVVSVFFVVAAIALYLEVGYFAVLAQCCGIAVVTCTSPSMLRAKSLRRIDRWAMKRAQRRRERRMRRHQRFDAWLVRAWQISSYPLPIGILCLLASGVLLLTGGPAGELARLGLALCLWPFAALFLLTIGISLYAQFKGDEATGPMIFHKAEGLAIYIEAHQDMVREVQLWGTLLTAAFIMLAALSAH
jgi:hypothetical protein